MFDNPLVYLLLIAVPLLGSSKALTQGLFARRKNPSLKENFIFTAIMSLIIVILIGTIFVRSMPSMWTIILGVIIGVLTFIFQSSYLQAFKKGPVSITGIVINLSIILPTIYGMAFLNEKISAFKIIGIVLVISSLILLNLKGKDDKSITVTWIIFLVIAFISAGSCNILQTIFKTLECGKERNELLFVTYLTCFILSTSAALIYKPKEKIDYKMNWFNICMPLIVGAILFGHNVLMMLSLSLMDASFYYPITSAINLLMLFAAGLILFKDKIKTTQIIGVVISIAAIVLLNII